MNSLSALSRFLSAAPRDGQSQDALPDRPVAVGRRKSKKRASKQSGDSVEAAKSLQEKDDDLAQGVNESALATTDSESSDGGSKGQILRQPSMANLRRNPSVVHVDVDLAAPDAPQIQHPVIPILEARVQQHYMRVQLLLEAVPVRISLAFYVLFRKLLECFGLTLRLPRRFMADVGLIANTSSLPEAPSLATPIVTGPPPSYEDATGPTNKKIEKKRRWRIFPFLRRTSSTTSRSKSPETTKDQLHAEAQSEARRSSFTSLFTSSKSSIAATAKAERAQQAQLALLARPKTLVLDLDETLIHSTNRAGGLAHVSSNGRDWIGRKDLAMRVVEVVLDGKSVVYHVYKRPWVDLFLCKVAAWYTVVIFTASMQEYADPVIDWLDQGRGLIGGRLFRESCHYSRGTYYKDLSVIDSDLSRLCLVDNSPSCYALNQANGIPIEGWVGDASDECLLDLLPLLDSLRFTTDVRRVLGLRGFAATEK